MRGLALLVVLTMVSPGCLSFLGFGDPAPGGTGGGGPSGPVADALRILVADLVDPRTGALVVEDLDAFLMTGSGPAGLRRTWVGAGAAGDFGPGWKGATDPEAGDRISIAREGGRITRATDPVGRATTYTYDSGGRLEKVDGPSGRLAFSYDGSGRLAAVRGFAATYAADGKVASLGVGNDAVVRFEYGPGTTTVKAPGGDVVYAFDGAGRVSKVTGPQGKGEVAYTASGKLASISFPGAGSWTFSWTGSGAAERLTEVRDGAGRVTRYAAEGSGIERTLPTGEKERHVFDDKGGVTERRDAAGAVWKFTRDADGRVTEVLDPLGGKTRASYDAAGRLVEVVDADGLTFAVDHATGRALARDPLGRVRAEAPAVPVEMTPGLPPPPKPNATFDAAGNLATIDVGGVFAFTYDASNRPTTIRDPSGKVATVEYDSAGRETAFTDPTGRRATRTYDAAGRIVAATDGLGRRETYEYTAAGRLAASTVSGARTTYAYDAGGLLSRETGPSGTITYTYDAGQRLVGMRDARGGAWNWTYDAAGRLVEERDPLGARTSHTYDAAGRRVSTTDPSGGITKSTYDARGAVTAIEHPGGGTTRRTFDARGLVTSETAPDGSVRRWTYDSAGRPVTETDGTNATTRFTYDALGRVRSITNPLGNTWTYAHDAYGNVVRATSPLGAAWNWTSDVHGRVLSASDPTSRTERTTYDAAGNVLRRVHAFEGREDVATSTYDANGLLSGTKRGGMESSVVRDANGRIVERNLSQGGSTLRVTYVWNAAGDLVSTSDSRGHKVVYTRDLLGRVTRIDDNLSGEVRVSKFVYDAAGRTIGRVLPNGVVTNTTYDVAGRPVSIRHVANGTTLVYGYEYDAAGRLARETGSNGPRTYAYDAAGRLVRVNDNGTVETYAYDAAGRRISSTQRELLHDALVSFTYAYDVDDRLLSRTTGDAAKNERFEWDRAGRMTLREIGGAEPTSTFVYGWGADGTLARWDGCGTGGCLTNFLRAPGIGGGTVDRSAFNFKSRLIDGAAYDDVALERSVATVTTTAALRGGDVNGLSDVYAYRSGYSLVSLKQGSFSTSADGASRNGQLDARGIVVAFESNATNLVSGVPSGSAWQVYARNTSLNQNFLVSVATDGTPGNGASRLGDVSADGRYVVFVSTATNLVANDANGAVEDVFRRDLVAQTTQLISQGSPQANAASHSPVVSRDGNVVAFVSSATNLAAGAEGPQVYVRKVREGTTVLASREGAGAPGNAASGSPAVSADGRVVAFVSKATNLAGATGGHDQVFTYDLATGTVKLASADPRGNAGDGPSRHPDIGADGDRVAFTTEARSISTPLFPGLEGPLAVARDLGTGLVESVAPPRDPSVQGGGTSRPKLSTAGSAYIEHGASPGLTMLASHGSTYAAWSGCECICDECPVTDLYLDDTFTGGSQAYTQSALPGPSGTALGWAGSPGFYPLEDGLNPEAATTNERGQVVSRPSFSAFGEVEPSTFFAAINPRGFAGLEWNGITRLYEAGSRMYDAGLGLFLTADDPRLAPPLDRYAYASSDPVNRIDPSGRTDTPRRPLQSLHGLSPVWETNQDYYAAANAVGADCADKARRSMISLTVGGQVGDHFGALVSNLVKGAAFAAGAVGAGATSVVGNIGQTVVENFVTESLKGTSAGEALYKAVGAAAIGVAIGRIGKTVFASEEAVSDFVGESVQLTAKGLAEETAETLVEQVQGLGEEAIKKRFEQDIQFNVYQPNWWQSLFLTNCAAQATVTSIIDTTTGSGTITYFFPECECCPWMIIMCDVSGLPPEGTPIGLNKRVGCALVDHGPRPN